MQKLICVLMLALAMTACGDDAKNGGGNNGNNGDNNGAGDLGNNGANDLGNNGIADMANNGADNNGTDPDMGMDMDTDMAGEEVAYTWPASADDFATTADSNSYIYQLLIPEVVEGTPVCCKDFGAISADEGTDNAVAKLANTLALVAGDIQANLDAAVQDGSFVVVLDHRELEGPNDVDNFLLSWLSGSFANATTYVDGAAGTGEFNIDVEGFQPGSGEPQIIFNPAMMSNSQMNAGPETIQVIVPLGVVNLVVPIEEAEVAGLADINQDGVKYTQGTISGFIQLTDIFDAMNGVVAASCSCLGLQGPLFVEGSQGWEGNCVTDAATLCAQEEICYVLAGDDLLSGETCGLLPTILQNSADIDTDNDQSSYEALSAGFTWEAAPASVVGSN